MDKLLFIGKLLACNQGSSLGMKQHTNGLLEHPKIVESAAVGVPDETRGQIVKVFTVVADGEDVNDALRGEIQEFCKKLTAPDKYPSEIEFVSILPKTISGKIRRLELREI